MTTLPNKNALPTDFNNPKRVTLTQADVGGLGQSIMILTQEIWVLSDRMLIMEAVLAERGVDISKDVENYQPDEKLQKRLNERGQRLVSQVLEALASEDLGD